MHLQVENRICPARWRPCYKQPGIGRLDAGLSYQISLLFVLY